MIKRHGQEISAAIDARLESLAAITPPPLSLKIESALAISVPMQTSFIVSLTLHALLVIGVGFTIGDHLGLAAPHNVLDVVLVNSKSESRPEQADALAQANLDGGGNTDEKRRAKTPLPNMEQRTAAQEAAQSEDCSAPLRR